MEEIVGELNLKNELLSAQVDSLQQELQKTEKKLKTKNNKVEGLEKIVEK